MRFCLKFTQLARLQNLNQVTNACTSWIFFFLSMLILFFISDVNHVFCTTVQGRRCLSNTTQSRSHQWNSMWIYLEWIRKWCNSKLPNINLMTQQWVLMNKEVWKNSEKRAFTQTFPINFLKIEPKPFSKSHIICKILGCDRRLCPK